MFCQRCFHNSRQSLKRRHIVNKHWVNCLQFLSIIFHPLDIIPLLPKLASPIKRITDKILGISYDDLEYKNTSGISEIEIKKIYENKSLVEWNILKEDFNLDFIIVPKDWRLNLNLVLDNKYRVYKIE